MTGSHAPVTLVHGETRFPVGEVTLWEPSTRYRQRFWLAIDPAAPSELDVRFTATGRTCWGGTPRAPAVPRLRGMTRSGIVTAVLITEALLPGRPGTPAEVAEAVAYVASPQAGFTTGQVLGVHGGTVLARS